MNAQELLTLARSKYPQAQWSLNKDASILAHYEPVLGRYKAVAMKTITGNWAMLEFEILANGKLPYTDQDFDPKEKKTTCD